MHVQELLVYFLRAAQEISPRHALYAAVIQEPLVGMSIRALLQFLAVCNEVNSPLPVKLCHSLCVVFEELFEGIDIIDQPIKVRVVDGMTSLLDLHDVKKPVDTDQREVWPLAFLADGKDYIGAVGHLPELLESVLEVLQALVLSDYGPRGLNEPRCLRDQLLKLVFIHRHVDNCLEVFDHPYALRGDLDRKSVV